MTVKFAIREPKPEPQVETVEFFLQISGEWVQLWASHPTTGSIKLLSFRPGERLCRETLGQGAFAILGLMPENNHSSCRWAIHT